MKIEAGMTSVEKLAVIEWHAEQDMLRAGTYGKYDGGVFRGCSIGCVIGGQVGDVHKRWADLIGAPKIIGLMIDSIFEGLPEADRPAWHVNAHRAVLDAVDRDADLFLIAHRHASQTLNRCLDYIGDGDEPWRVECRRVVKMARDATAAGTWLTDEEAEEAVRAERAAWAERAERAARSAWVAEAAWVSWAEEAGWIARAAEAAEAARVAQARRRPARAEGEEERQAQAKDLIELLKQA